MAKKRELQIFITGNAEDAQRAFRSVEQGSSRLSKAGGALKKFAKVGGAALLGLATAGVAFGAASVKAYAEAETSQLRLSEAFRKFPAISDTNRAALQKLNSALALKTKFDDDATASAQANLAQFGLTGAQLTALTPLVQDYAAKTGKDLPDAANTLGKALLGKGKALAAVGIKFKDAGSVAANYDQVMAGLRQQVGGFAEQEGKSAAGGLAILKNAFGEVQEKVGAALMPALKALMPVINALVPILGEALGGVAKALAPPLLKLAAALGPVMTTVVKTLTPVLGTLFDALGEILVAVVPLLPPLAKLLVAFTPLIPPISKLITLLVKMLMPVLTPLMGLLGGVATILAEVLAHALGVVTALLEPLAGVFRAVGRAIEPVTRFVKSLADKISHLHLPDWLIPGSPTPLELGLRGISKALKEAQGLSRGFGVGDMALAGVGATRMAPAAGRAEKAPVIINLNGAVLGDVPKVVEHIRRELLRTKTRNGSTGL
jgi:hypothetical protein